MSMEKFELLSPVENLLHLDPALYAQFMKEMNEAIETYNISEKRALRIQALQDMEIALGNVFINQPPLNRKSFSDFHLKQTDLVLLIKKAYLREGINPERFFSNCSAVAQIISSYQMSAPKARDLVTILMQPSKNLATQLLYLYGFFPLNQEARNWATFIANHTFRYLGGFNSHIYWVENTLNHSGRILKVENRRQRARHVATNVKRQLPHLFPPLEALRPVEAHRKDGLEGVVTRNLLVTKYCTGGSLETHRYSIRDDGNRAIYTATAKIMGQMARALLDIQQTDAFFSDAKWDNWGIDVDLTQIQVIDDKGFVKTFNGRYYSSIEGNIGILYTPGFEPSEVNDPDFDAEKFHAFVLGVNIACYLTGLIPSDATPDHPLFHGEIGEAYLHLIHNLTNTNPALRMSLSEALILLRELECKISPEYQELCQQLEEKNQSTDLSHDYKLLVTHFIKTRASQDSFCATKTLSDLKDFIRPLEATYHSCEKEIKKYTEDVCPRSATYICAIAKTQLTQIVLVTQPCTDFEKDFITKMHTAKAKITLYHEQRNTLDSLKYGYRDENMAEFIRACDGAIQLPGSYADKMAQLDKQNGLLARTIGGLSTPEHQEIKRTIKTLQSNNPLWICGKSAQAADILKAMRDVPIQVRSNLLKTPFKVTQQIWEALIPKSLPSVYIHRRKKNCRSPAADMRKKFQIKFLTTDVEPSYEDTGAPLIY